MYVLGDPITHKQISGHLSCVAEISFPKLRNEMKVDEGKE